MDNIHESIDSCQNKVSADLFHLTMAGWGVDPSRSSTFLKLSADKLLVFKWSQSQVYYFKNSYEICCVYVTMANTIKILILIKLTSDAKIQPVF